MHTPTCQRCQALRHLRSPKVRSSPLPLLVPVGQDVLPCLWIRSGRVTTILGRGLPCPLVSGLEASGCAWIDWGPLVFGTPTLLQRKANDIASGPVPPLPQSSLPPQPSPPPPVAKCPRRDRELIGQMRGLLRTGAWRLDTLRGAQMAAQEASGVMAAAMLRQQGAMREVSVWESEVEGVMREMLRLVDGAEPDM